jgi:hypothetical protein
MNIQTCLVFEPFEKELLPAAVRFPGWSARENVTDIRNQFTNMTLLRKIRAVRRPLGHIRREI